MKENLEQPGPFEMEYNTLFSCSSELRELIIKYTKNLE